jgi:hypothetical protein
MSEDSRIKCLRCESFIHETDRCWNSCKIYCKTDQKYKEDCNCDHCGPKCKYCQDKINSPRCRLKCAFVSCPICNEHMLEYERIIRCFWDHTVPPCEFCGLPISHISECINSHRKSVSVSNNKEYPICKDCNMPEVVTHRHDGTKCQMCDTLLNEGKCIYKCVNSGASCIKCNYHGIVNGKCRSCGFTQGGQLTKRALK